MPREPSVPAFADRAFRQELRKPVHLRAFLRRALPEITEPEENQQALTRRFLGTMQDVIQPNRAIVHTDRHRAGPEPRTQGEVRRGFPSGGPGAGVQQRTTPAPAALAAALALS